MCSLCAIPHTLSTSFVFSSAFRKRQVCLRVCQRAWASGWGGQGLAALGCRGSAMVQLAQSRAGQTCGVQRSQHTQKGRRRRLTSLWGSRTQKWSFKNKHTPHRRSDTAVKADGHGFGTDQGQERMKRSSKSNKITPDRKITEGTLCCKAKPIEYYASQEKQSARKKWARDDLKQMKLNF